MQNSATKLFKTSEGDSLRTSKRENKSGLRPKRKANSTNHRLFRTLLGASFN